MKHLLTFVTLFAFTFMLYPVQNSQAGMLGKVVRAGGSAASGVKTYRQSRIGEGALTVAMLEECIIDSKRMDNVYDSIKAIDQEIDPLGQQIDTSEAYINQNSDKVDTTSQASVDQWNNKIKSHQKIVKEYNQILESRKEKLADYKRREAKFKRLCANQEYYEDDYATAVKNVGYGMK